MEMTLRLPKVPESGKVRKAIAVPLFEDFVVDTFTRSGSLFDSDGETGAEWTVLFGDPDLAMDGAALYSNATTGSYRGAYPSGTPPGASYGAEVEFTFDPSVSSALGIRLYLRLDDPLVGDCAIELEWGASNGNLNINAYNATDYIENDIGNVGPTTAGSYKLTVEVSGLTVSMRLDDVVMGTLDVSSIPELALPGIPALRIRDTSFGTGPLSNTASLQIDSYRAYPV